jgi:uncharacterized RDD family membrane protein YckC
MVVGFWLRLLSDFIDALILMAFGHLLSLPLRRTFVALGENGVWLGLLITFLYMGLLQSRLGHGQSLAKKLLGIQVLRADGAFLSYGASFARYLLISIVFYSSLYSLALQHILFFIPHAVVAGVVNVVWVALAIGCFLMVAFHPTKRGLHDLLAGSMVVRKGSFDGDRLARLAHREREQLLLVLTGLGMVAILGMGTWMSVRASGNADLGRVIAVRDRVAASSKLEDLSVASQELTVNGGDTRRWLIVSGFARGVENGNEEALTPYFDATFAAIRSAATDLQGYDGIRVTVRTGYSIGIAKDYQMVTMEEKPGAASGRAKVGWQRSW